MFTITVWLLSVVCLRVEEKEIPVEDISFNSTTRLLQTSELLSLSQQQLKCDRSILDAQEKRLRDQKEKTVVRRSRRLSDPLGPDNEQKYDFFGDKNNVDAGKTKTYASVSTPLGRKGGSKKRQSQALGGKKKYKKPLVTVDDDDEKDAKPKRKRKRRRRSGKKSLNSDEEWSVETSRKKKVKNFPSSDEDWTVETSKPKKSKKVVNKSASNSKLLFQRGKMFFS